MLQKFFVNKIYVHRVQFDIDFITFLFKTILGVLN